jgi:asparagine synthase (glutamine-hydrolysing)
VCGICGIISRSPLLPRDIEAVRKSNAAMAHRGPDGAGEYRDGFAPPPSTSTPVLSRTEHFEGWGAAASGSFNNQPQHVFLAMRRLSIIDLEGGWQPLYNENRSIALVANAEIYNFVELRMQLEAQGHLLRTNSDCETIVHLYEQYGLDCVHHLRGMFAFALWDSHLRRLIIARDRLGEKPLYIHRETDRLLFASEMKAILKSGLVQFEIEPTSVHEYLHYQWVPEPRTMVKGVHKLAPAHMLVLNLDEWQINEHSYWNMEDAPEMDGNPADLVRAELESISELTIRADVPVGIAMSGGVDSSLLAALSTKKYKGTMQAFSVGYTGRPAQDERQDAKEFSGKLGMPFHEIEISTSELVEFYPKLNALRDDPIADIAGYGYYLISKCAREHGCRVLIQGHGGDELFWGYSWAKKAMEHTLAKMQGKQKSAFREFLSWLPRGLSRPQIVKFVYLLGGMLYGWRKLVPGPNSPANQMVFYDVIESYQAGEHMAHKAYTKKFARAIGDYSAASVFRIDPPWEHVDVRIMGLVCSTYLLQNGIAQGDRLSMANSVELRLPLIDYRLAELVVGLQKIKPSHNLPAKQWLKDAVHDILPAEIFQRPKRGFNPPVSQWMGAIIGRYSEILSSGYLVSNDVLDPKTVSRITNPHSRFSPERQLCWMLLELESWCRSMAAI